MVHLKQLVFVWTDEMFADVCRYTAKKVKRCLKWQMPDVFGLASSIQSAEQAEMCHF